MTETKKMEWQNWFAGFIDGDGSIIVYKDHVSIEASTGLEDEGILCEIKKHFGGSITRRANAKALRWRSRKKDVVLSVLKSLNGYIRNTVRKEQFIKACEFYDIKVEQDKALLDNYYAGLFDADGSISLSVYNWDKKKELNNVPGNYGKAQRLLYSRGHNQCVIKFTNKYKKNVEGFRERFSIGTLYNEKGSLQKKKSKWKNKSTDKWHWVLNQEEIHEFANILLTTAGGLKGRKKKNRLFLVRTKYLELKAMKAHLADEKSEMFKEWKKFCYTWYKLN